MAREVLVCLSVTFQTNPIVCAVQSALDAINHLAGFRTAEPDYGEACRYKVAVGKLHDSALCRVGLKFR